MEFKKEKHKVKHLGKNNFTYRDMQEGTHLESTSVENNQRVDTKLNESTLRALTNKNASSLLACIRHSIACRLREMSLCTDLVNTWNAAFTVGTGLDDLLRLPPISTILKIHDSLMGSLLKVSLYNHNYLWKRIQMGHENCITINCNITRTCLEDCWYDSALWQKLQWLCKDDVRGTYEKCNVERSWKYQKRQKIIQDLTDKE